MCFAKSIVVVKKYRRGPNWMLVMCHIRIMSMMK